VTFELKRYTIRPDGFEGFLALWRDVVAVRRRHGFDVLFAFADREHSVFTWAIGHDGDIDAAAQAFYDDPERLRIGGGLRDHITEFEIRRVEQVAVPV
jgi:hypothetical protein